MIKEMVNDEEISNSNKKHSFCKLAFLEDSIKDILFFNRNNFIDNFFSDSYLI